MVTAKVTLKIFVAKTSVGYRRIQRPAIVIDYISTWAEVNTSVYAHYHISLKWWKHVFFAILSSVWLMPHRVQRHPYNSLAHYISWISGSMSSMNCCPPAGQATQHHLPLKLHSFQVGIIPRRNRQDPKTKLCCLEYENPT